MKPRFWFNFQPGSPSRLYSTEKIWPHFFGLQDPSSLSDYSASLKKRRNTRKNNANLCIKEENLLLITDHSLLLFTFLFVSLSSFHIFLVSESMVCLHFSTLPLNCVHSCRDYLSQSHPAISNFPSSPRPIEFFRIKID